MCVSFKDDLKYAKFDNIFSLFDSGRPRSFVRRACVTNFANRPLIETQYFGIGKQPMMSFGKICCSIKLNDKTLTHKLVVVPNETIFCTSDYSTSD